MSTASALEITLKFKIIYGQLVRSATPAAVRDDTEVVPPKCPEANCSERVYPAILLGRVDLRVDRKLAVAQALNAVEKERDKLASELQQAKHATQNAAQLAEMTRSKDLQEAAAKKDAEIQALKAQLESNQVNQKLAINEAVGSVEKQRDALQNSLQQTELEKQLAEKSLKDKYETQLKDRDEAIERLRDMKAKLSTKMVGETLEQRKPVKIVPLFSLV